MSHTVLVCDDAIFMRTMVGDILQEAGFDVVGEAETGTDAVTKYKALRPDLVTMDIVMPDMGGIDAVREIVRYDPQARVLMCSAMGQQALLALEREPGARVHVDTLFRAMHTLKGMSATMGYDNVAKLAHDLEDVLDVIRRDSHIVSPELIDALLAANDALERAIEQATSGAGDSLDVAPVSRRVRSAASFVPGARPRDPLPEAPN